LIGGKFCGEGLEDFGCWRICFGEMFSLTVAVFLLLTDLREDDWSVSLLGGQRPTTSSQRIGYGRKTILRFSLKQPYITSSISLWLPYLR
jgi:hypothetical protein